jgi:hypothetical protein
MDTNTTMEKKISEEKQTMDPLNMRSGSKDMLGSAATLDQSIEGLKQHLDRQLTAFSRDLAVRMDANLGKQLQFNRTLEDGRDGWFSCRSPTPHTISQAMQPGLFSQQAGMPIDARLPPPPAYEGVCGGIVLNRPTQRGLPGS